MHTEENGDVAVLVLFGLIHLDIGGGIKILILGLVCCLWSWRVSWVFGGGSKILIFELVCCL